MSLYQCEKCGCVENTALGHYHCRGMFDLPEEALCSECAPSEDAKGEPTKYGKWHGRFPKRIYPLGTLYTDNEGNVRRKSDNKYPHE